ncbi:beta subunit of phenylalanyl-tRNA synthetase [Tothia fuscella]|uniref:Phenylalanine--tRNA ligase beta subunit n=1 Tax=Tothia fuscella TaxID=1048955 RepID=A0A9P4NYF2_9PEZI|nr:beta subunit of phenylalanyl-tRNA synthetase [Tothia fuscella]
MPTISVDKAELFKAIGKDEKYTSEEFDELCFEFGIELDEDTTDQDRPMVNGVREAPQLKIEIPANRYDMLCFEGIALNLNVFLGNQTCPNYRLVAPSGGELQTMIVHEPTKDVRSLVSCAVLRNITFTQERYNSFISLQDKLHANLARQRTLVSIGTHDLDTIQGPFHYKAEKPDQIKFVALNQDKTMTAADLMNHYEKDKHLGRFLHIIKDKPKYPVIYDDKNRVLSLPPIINSNHSKIKLTTKNVFIEITATDKTKVEIVNQMLIAMFSQYCDEPFTVEPVKIVSEHNSQTRETPDLSPREMVASVSYMNECTGLTLSTQEQCDLLKKMGHKATPSKGDDDSLDISVPIIRADVLHQADIMEDLAVAYGFNKLPRYYPNKSGGVGAPLPINKLSDVVRTESAMAGWTEALPLILCSHDENYAWLNRKDDGTKAIRLQNPKSLEYQIVRTSLLPGLLKTVRENKHRPVPLKVFEVSDVAFKALELERKTRNERHLGACWYGKTSGFEVVHGLLDRVMGMLDVAFRDSEKVKKDGKVNQYWIEELDDPTFFHGHSASIHVKLDGGKDQIIGEFGVLHPTVLKNYELPFPVSALEINLEDFL